MLPIMVNFADISFDRRTALSWGAAGAAAAGLSATGVAHAQLSSGRTAQQPSKYQPIDAELPFLHGVASGDPLPSSVVLWTRVTPDRDALPGSGLGVDVRVRWEIARDPGFADVVASGEAVASAAHDHTVHVDPHGLEAATVYYYRFTVADGSHAGATSPVGRTKTAPAADAEVEQVNFAIASCANWESGYFAAYKDMAAQGQADAFDCVVFLGDYIYEYGTGEYVGKNGVVRPHHPSWEIVTVEDYRMRYGRYRTDAHLQAAHAAAPWVVIWDDHETANNSWRHGAENHTDGYAEGTWPVRFNAAMQAYYEWMPLRQTRPSKEGHLYRNLRFGTLVELTMMDLRSYRDAETTLARYSAPDRTMMGSEQYQWLERTVTNSQARWMVMGNSVMMAPMRLLTIPGNPDADAALQHVKATTSGFPLNSDQWDGYTADRDRLLTLLAQRGERNLFLTGDIHSEWANSIFHQGKEVACEMVTTSISAPNIDDLLTQYTGIPHNEDNPTTILVENTLRGANPWVRHVDFDAHGYGIARISSDRVDMEFRRVSSLADNNASVAPAVSVSWAPGSGFGS